MDSQLAQTLQFIDQLSNQPEHVREKYLDIIQRRINLIQEKTSEEDENPHPFYNWIIQRYGSMRNGISMLVM